MKNFESINYTYNLQVTKTCIVCTLTKQRYLHDIIDFSNKKKVMLIVLVLIAPYLRLLVRNPGTFHASRILSKVQAQSSGKR